MTRLSYNYVQGIASIVSRYYREAHPMWERWIDADGHEYRDGAAIYLERNYGFYSVYHIDAGSTGHKNLCVGSLRECLAYLEAMRDFYNFEW